MRYLLQCTHKVYTVYSTTSEKIMYGGYIKAVVIYAIYTVSLKINGTSLSRSLNHVLL